MARTLTPLDGYAIMTELVREATGQKTAVVNDLSSFVSAGETVMATGTENVYNALGIVMGRMFVATRPYKARLWLINALNTACYTSRMRKISFYAKDALASGFFNTNLFTNLADGFTAGENESGGTPQSTKSQWEQHQAMPLEMNFAGSTVWDDCLTQYEEQVRAAFRGPQELAEYVQGQLVEHANDVESQKEAFNRIALLSKIGACYLYSEGVNWSKNQSINLTKAFNDRFGTTYTSAQLRSTYLKDFLAFMTAEIRKHSDYMTERTAKYHLPMTKTVNGVSYSILRHTPYDKQRLFLFEPLFRDAEAMVLPEIFRPEYLDIKKQYEGVSFWQESGADDDARAAVKVRVPYLDINDGTQKSSGNIELPYVVGILFDEDAVMVDYQLERALSTPVEARKGYRNTWLHFAKNAINDPTENAVMFYMADYAENTPAPDDGEGT